MIKKIIALFITAIVISVAIYFISSVPKEKPVDKLVDTSINNFQECLKAGFPIMESWPRGCRTADGQMFTEDIGNQLDKTDLIQVTEPQANQEISTPLLIKGQARGYWFFEASFPIELQDSDKVTIATGIAQAKGEWMTTDFVLFEAQLDFKRPLSKNGYLVLKKDNPSGEPQNDDQLILPIMFNQDSMSVKVFFTTSQTAGENDFDCKYLEAVSKQVPKSPGVARSALLALLEGPSAEDKDNGFDTAINQNVKINSLTIVDGVAKIDFDEQIQYQVGGSCRVASIREQIEQTLKQFPSIKSVIISVNGELESALQP
jgi:hypothetical protein